MCNFLLSLGLSAAALKALAYFFLLGAGLFIVLIAVALLLCACGVNL